jgi:hypothetical protein
MSVSDLIRVLGGEALFLAAAAWFVPGDCSWCSWGQMEHFL